jgi:parvulin-like peptidyl-prolyl isomerase
MPKPMIPSFLMLVLAIGLTGPDLLASGAATTASEASAGQAEIKATPDAEKNGDAAPVKPGEATKMPPVVMARVGTATITVEDFMHFLSKNPSRVREAITIEGKAALLKTAIENRLLLAAMRQDGLIDDDTKSEKLPAAFNKFAAAHFPLPPVPDEETLRAYYDAHRDDFGIPAAVRLTQIQFRLPDPATEEDKAAARARAEAALKRIEAGEAFGDVAGEVTERPETLANKGDVGFVYHRGHEWLEKALVGLQVGQHTGVLESPAGYDILMLTETRDAEITPFDQAREAVAKKMQEEGQAAARSAYIKKLAATVEINIELDSLKDAYPNGIFP